MQTIEKLEIIFINEIFFDAWIYLETSLTVVSSSRILKKDQLFNQGLIFYQKFCTSINLFFASFSLIWIKYLDLE